MEILKQPQYQPLTGEKQVAILYAGTKGYLDNYPKDVVAKYEAGLYPFLDNRFPELLPGIAEKSDITDELEELMKKALEAYDEEFKDTIK